MPLWYIYKVLAYKAVTHLNSNLHLSLSPSLVNSFFFFVLQLTNFFCKRFIKSVAERQTTTTTTTTTTTRRRRRRSDNNLYHLLSAARDNCAGNCESLKIFGLFWCAYALLWLWLWLSCRQKLRFACHWKVVAAAWHTFHALDTSLPPAGSWTWTLESGSLRLDLLFLRARTAVQRAARTTFFAPPTRPPPSHYLYACNGPRRSSRSSWPKDDSALSQHIIAGINFCIARTVGCIYHAEYRWVTIHEINNSKKRIK